MEQWTEKTKELFKEMLADGAIMTSINDYGNQKYYKGLIAGSIVTVSAFFAGELICFLDDLRRQKKSEKKEDSK